MRGDINVALGGNIHNVIYLHSEGGGVNLDVSGDVLCARCRIKIEAKNDATIYFGRKADILELVVNIDKGSFKMAVNGFLRVRVLDLAVDGDVDIRKYQKQMNLIKAQE